MAVERALAVLLLWNAIAGPFLLLMPVLFADENAMARRGFGVMASSTPTAVAGVWLCVLGLVALEYRRQSNPVWHWTAACFYLFQVVAVFTPIRIVFWTGIFLSVPVELKPGHLVAFNFVSAILLAVHVVMAPRRTIPLRTTSSGQPAPSPTAALAASFEAVLGPITLLAIVDLVVQLIALTGWNPLGSLLAAAWNFFPAIGVLVGLPLGLICVFSKRLGLNALGAAMVALVLANAYRFLVF